MKANELTKIRELSDAELGKKLEDLKDELFHLRFQHAINQLEDTDAPEGCPQADRASSKPIQRERELKAEA